jgi:hypothetical protein
VTDMEGGSRRNIPTVAQGKVEDIRRKVRVNGSLSMIIAAILKCDCTCATIYVEVFCVLNWPNADSRGVFSSIC